jgi:uncharacterized membrane protein
MSKDDNQVNDIPEVSIIERFADKAVLALTALYIIFFSVVGALRYKYFDFGDYDFAIYAQVLWNLLRGTTFSSILGLSYLAGHTGLILFFIIPFYFVIKTPVLLLIIQTIAVASGGYILHRFAAKILNKTWAFILFLLYLMYPPVIYSNLFEFHPVTLSIPFLFLSFWAYKDAKFSRFIIFSTLAILCKENMPLIIMMYGILALVDRRPIKWITTPLILGISSFGILVFVIKPYFNKGIIDLFLLYKEFGDTPKEIILGLISSPGKVMTAVISKGNLNFIIKQLSSVVFLPLLALKNLIPASLVLMQHLLSWRTTEKTIVYHYTAKFAPFIFISASYGLKKVLSSKYVKEVGRMAAPFLITLLLGVSLAINIAVEGRVSGTLDRVQKLAQNSKENFINQKFIDIIPKDAAVVSTFKFLPKLSHRKELHSFHHIHMGTYTFSSVLYPLPEKLDYALIDFSDEMTFNFKSSRSYDFLKRFFYNYNWRVVDSDGSIVLFENSDSLDLNGIFQVIQGEPKVTTLVNGKINDQIELIGFNWSAGKEEKLWEARFSFYWRCLKNTRNDYNSIIGLVNRYGQLVKLDKKYMCYRIYPTHQWQEGQIIREDYWYVFPPNLPRMKYHLTLGMVDEYGRKTIGFKTDKEGVLDRNGFVILLEI